MSGRYFVYLVLFCFKSGKSLPMGSGDKTSLICERLCLASTAVAVRVLGLFSSSLRKIKNFVITIIL